MAQEARSTTTITTPTTDNDNSGDGPDISGDDGIRDGGQSIYFFVLLYHHPTINSNKMASNHRKNKSKTSADTVVSG